MQTLGLAGNTLFWRLTYGDAGLGEALSGHYVGLLVVLSVLVAIVAGFSALMILDRIRASEKPGERRLWLVLGACAMGSGVCRSTRSSAIPR
jgi:hypothetical protein